MYIIDRDVPLPDARTGLYPFRQMSVGDSFMVPVTPTQPPCVIKGRLKSAYRKFRCKVPSYRVTIRTVPGGVRLWRTA